MFDEFKNKIMEIEIDELKEIKKIIDKAINEKSEKKFIIYKHSCFGSSSYHFSKYTHWAKLIKEIDNSKTNGYAFIGEFLKVDSENLIKVGSFIVESCSDELKLYKVVNEENIQLLLKGRKKEFISFIKKVKEITGL